MAWTPANTLIGVDAIPENLLAYCLDDDRQADALTWAGGHNLKLIKTFSATNAARDRPVYPLILLAADIDEQEFGYDIIDGRYTAAFDVRTQHADPDTVAANGRVYKRALCSMIVNIPQATLIAGTGATQAVLQTLRIVMQPVKTNDARNDFFQDIEVRALYTVHRGAYA